MLVLTNPTIENCAELVTLRSKFFDTQIKTGLLDLPIDRKLMLETTTPKLIKSSRVVLRMGWLAGVPVGYVYGSRKAIPGVQKSVVCAIEEIYVGDDARRSGLASELFSAAKDEFIQTGADRIQLRVLSANAAGHEFWKAKGFFANVVTYELDF